jgi:sRNA-binding carbon storage regulator CsrA
MLHVRGGKVRLGFAAPRDVRILREEVRNGSAADDADDSESKEIAVEALPSLT